MLVSGMEWPGQKRAKQETHEENSGHSKANEQGKENEG